MQTSTRAHSGGPGQGLVGGSTKGLLGEIVLFISCFFKVMLILFQHVCFELFKVVVELLDAKATYNHSGITKQINF